MDFYEFGEIDGHTWWIRDIFGDYCYCLEGNQKAVLIDTGMGLPGLKDLVGTLVHVPVTVVLTHGHLDHIGGCGLWEDVRMHREDEPVRLLHQSARYRGLIEGLAQEIGVNLDKKSLESCIHMRPPGKVTFLEEGILELGGRRLEVIHTPGHTGGSICLLERTKRRLFSGDTICEKRVMLSFGESLPPEGYRQSMRKLTEFHRDIQEIYSGHNQNPLDQIYLQEYEICADLLVNSPEKLEVRKETSVFGECMVCKSGTVELTVPARGNGRNFRK